MKLILFIYLCFLLTFQQSTQEGCLDEKGEAVDWWVILNIPGLKADPIGNYTNKQGKINYLYNYPGYAYYDSNDHKVGRNKFHVFDGSSYSENTALYRTLNQIKKQKMSTIAWSDQWCNSSDYSKGATAHSKAFGAYNQHSEKGFFISHSVPRYPCFDKNGQINVKINTPQQKFGQNMLCISGDKYFLKNLISKVPPMNVNVYWRNFNCKQIFGSDSNINDDCSNIFGKKRVEQPDYTHIFSVFQYLHNKNVNFKLIFKRSDQKIRESILDHGVTQYLESSIVSQTWNGTNQSCDCSRKYRSQIVQKIKLNDQYQWISLDDHSKWIIAIENDYVCYGDMNRAEQQQERGGAFYCLNSPGLHAAMWNMVNCQDCILTCKNVKSDKEL